MRKVISKMKNLEICAKKVIIDKKVLSKNNLTQEEQRCLYDCEGYNNKCSGYFIIKEECMGL